jgi:hypothetical protein
VHLLKALTFPPEFKHSIVIDISSAPRMLFTESLKGCEETITDFDHLLPP